jgi:hypothetical protein
MSGFISSSPFQNTKHFLQFQSLAPGIARRSSGRFQLRRQLRRAITPKLCIVCRIREYCCVRLVEGFVGARSVCRFLLGSGEGLLHPWETSIVVLMVSSFLRFFVFPSVQGLPHFLLTFPDGGASPASVSPPVAPLLPLPGGGGGGRRCQPRFRARAPLPGGGGRT